jgi:spore germination protein
MNSNRPITTVQVVAVIVSTIIGIGILSIPRYMAEAGDSAAPLISASGIPLAFLGCWFTAAVCRKFPNETLFIFSRRLLGTGLADFFTILISLLFAFSTGITMRQFGEVCALVIFKKTPIEMVILLMLVLGALSIRRNIVKFTYVHVFYLPFILLTVLSIGLMSMNNIDALNLLPITGNHLTASGFTEGMITSASLYQGTFVIVLLVPLMKQPRQVLKAGSIGLLIIGCIYVMIVLVALGMFGAQETMILSHPTIETARSISIGGGLLERLDAVFIIAWVISIFTSIFTNYYLATYSLQKVLRFKDHRLLSSFMLPLIFIFSLFPRNIFQVNTAASVTGIVGLTLLTLYPLLLWLVSIFRNKGEAAHE